MGRVIIPIADHVSGLHKGHLQVIDFANEFPGTKVVRVIKDAKRWRQHLLTGTPFTAPRPVSSKMRTDLNKKMYANPDKVETSWEEVNVQSVPEIQRVVMYKKANALISLYEDVLLLDEYKRRAMILLMGLLSFSHVTIDRNDIFVRGPDLVSFFQNSVRKLIGAPEVKIYPHIIKSEETKIREQGSLDDVPTYYDSYVKRLGSMIAGAAPYFRPGRNSKLVVELNEAYISKPWSIRGIAVYEGGMVQGRLENVLISFPSNNGTVIIEDTNYYN